jgi:hypothetical protein
MQLQHNIQIAQHLIINIMLLACLVAKMLRLDQMKN